MAWTVTKTARVQRDNGSQVFPGTGILTGTGATESEAEASIDSQLQTLINNAQGNVNDLTAAQGLLGT